MRITYKQGDRMSKALIITGLITFGSIFFNPVEARTRVNVNVGIGVGAYPAYPYPAYPYPYAYPYYGYYGMPPAYVQPYPYPVAYPYPGNCPRCGPW